MISAQELSVVASLAAEAKTYASELAAQALALSKIGITYMLLSQQGRLADPVFLTLVLDHLAAAGYRFSSQDQHIEMIWGEKEVSA